MAIKVSRRKRSFKAKRSAKRKTRVSRPLSRKYNTFTRKANLGPILITNGSNGYAAYSAAFSLQNIPGYGEFVPLYEHYRLNYINLYVVSRNNVTTMMEGVNNYIGMLQGICYTDTDDAIAPSATEAGMNELREIKGSKTHYFGSDRKSMVWKIRVNPRVLTEVHLTSDSAALSVSKPLWLNTNRTDVPHYGLKMILRVPLAAGTMPGTVPYPVDLYATYSVSFKNPR